MAPAARCPRATGHASAWVVRRPRVEAEWAERVGRVGRVSGPAEHTGRVCRLSERTGLPAKARRRSERAA